MISLICIDTSETPVIYFSPAQVSCIQEETINPDHIGDTKIILGNTHTIYTTHSVNEVVTLIRGALV